MRLTVLTIFIFANFASSQLPAVDTTPAITLCFYDLESFSSASPAEKKDWAASTIKRNRAQIVVLAGIKDKTALIELQKSLEGFVFSNIIEAADNERHLGVISKIKPEKYESLTDIKYKIEETELPVQRGFMHCVFNIEGYKFHLLAADLKDRTKDPKFNQTDMRRYEARQLRRLATEIIKENPENNLIILGNLNDTCGMAPIKEIYNRRFDIVKKLFDIRPIDSLKTSWTYWNTGTDDYERIDYAITTSSMLPELLREKTYISEDEQWPKASRHRPIVVTFTCKDAEHWSKEKLDEIFPNSIYEGTASHFDKDKPVGEKPKRNPPGKKQDGLPE